MKYLKTYKLFESLNRENFPKIQDIEEFFYELTDDGILSKCEFIDSGYLIYPEYRLLATSDKTVRSALIYAMYDDPNWEKQRHPSIFNETFGSIFQDPSNPLINLRRDEEEISFKEMEDLVYRMRVNTLPNKTLIDYFVESIEGGKIPAVPFLRFNCGLFYSKNLQQVVDCLLRIYEATGLRPFRQFWNEDYVDKNTGDIVTMIGLNIDFTKVDDKTYKNLVNSYNDNDISKQITQNFN